METVKRAFCVCLSDPFVMASGGAAGCFILLLSVRLGPLSRRGSDVRMDDTGRISVFLGVFSSSNLINP